MRTKSMLALGLLGLVAATSLPAEAAVKVGLAAGTISMGGGFFGVPGTITADPALSLFVVSSSISFTDGYGSLLTDYIDQDLVLAAVPLAAGQTFSGEQAGTVNGSGPFLFTTDYTGIHAPPFPINSTGFLTLGYHEGSLTAPLQSLTVSFVTSTAVTPEPGFLSLMASGMVGSGLFLMRRRRK